MIPVLQTRVSSTDGDCFQAAIASILELPLTDVPVAPATDPADDGAWTLYLYHLDEWLATLGLGLLAISLAEKTRLSALGDSAVPSGYWIVGIDSLYPGCAHCLVARARMIVHDPEQNPLVPVDPEVDAIFAFVLRDPADYRLQADLSAAREALNNTDLLHWLGSTDVMDVSAGVARAASAVHRARKALAEPR